MLTIDLKNKAFDILWKNALIGLAIVDSNGKFLYVNPNFCKIVEYTEAELEEKTFQSITHPDDTSADTKMSKRLADDDNDEHEYVMKKRYITKTGKIVWVVLKANRIERDNGDFAFFLSQVSELIEILPPQSKPVIPTSKSIRNTLVWSWIKSYSAWIFAILGGLTILVAKIIEYLGN